MNYFYFNKKHKRSVKYSCKFEQFKINSNRVANYKPNHINIEFTFDLGHQFESHIFFDNYHLSLYIVDLNMIERMIHGIFYYHSID